jgi:hypothetical protein
MRTPSVELARRQAADRPLGPAVNPGNAAPSRCALPDRGARLLWRARPAGKSATGAFPFSARPLEARLPPLRQTVLGTGSPACPSAASGQTAFARDRTGGPSGDQGQGWPLERPGVRAPRACRVPRLNAVTRSVVADAEAGLWNRQDRFRNSLEIQQRQKKGGVSPPRLILPDDPGSDQPFAGAAAVPPIL